MGGGRDQSGDAKPSDAATVSSLGLGATTSAGRAGLKSVATNTTTGSTDTSGVAEVAAAQFARGDRRSVT